MGTGMPEGGGVGVPLGGAPAGAWAEPPDSPPPQAANAALNSAATRILCMSVLSLGRIRPYPVVKPVAAEASRQVAVSPLPGSCVVRGRNPKNGFSGVQITR
jgi:hypothetical protein